MIRNACLALALVLTAAATACHKNDSDGTPGSTTSLTAGSYETTRVVPVGADPSMPMTNVPAPGAMTDRSLTATNTPPVPNTTITQPQYPTGDRGQPVNGAPAQTKAAGSMNASEPMNTTQPMNSTQPMNAPTNGNAQPNQVNGQTPFVGSSFPQPGDLSTTPQPVNP